MCWKHYLGVLLAGLLLAGFVGVIRVVVDSWIECAMIIMGSFVTTAALVLAIWLLTSSC